MVNDLSGIVMGLESCFRRFRRKGLFRSLFGVGEGPIWLICDPIGFIFAGVTYLLIGYGVFAVATITILPEVTALTVAQFSVFISCAYLALTSHIKAMMTNPGTVPLGTEGRDVLKEYCDMYETDEDEENDDREERYRYCQPCNAPKPYRAHHCRTCERCIRKADHHCIWVNNCIGENNMKFFVLFNLYIFLIASLALVYLFLHIAKCGHWDWKAHCLYYSDVSTFLIMMFLFMEGLLFSLFCCIMGLNILSAIQSDETAIDKYKREVSDGQYNVNRGPKRMSSFEAVFGRPRSVLWLSPLTTSRVCAYLQRRAPFQRV